MIERSCVWIWRLSNSALPINGQVSVGLDWRPRKGEMCWWFGIAVRSAGRSDIATESDVGGKFDGFTWGSVESYSVVATPLMVSWNQAGHWPEWSGVHTVQCRWCACFLTEPEVAAQSDHCCMWIIHAVEETWRFSWFHSAPCPFPSWLPCSCNSVRRGY